MSIYYYIGFSVALVTEHNLSVLYDCSPVLGTNYSEFDWFLPQTGLQFAVKVCFLASLKKWA